MSYRVAVGNPFDGLDDENEDPKHRTPKPKMAPAEKASDAPKTVKAKPEAPASKAAATPASAPAQKPASAAVQKPADASLKKKPAARNPVRRDGNSGAPRNENGDNAARRDYQKEKSYDRKDRGPRQEGAPRRGRQFDRHSGTGRPPTENKKGGSGAGNWGDETKEGIVAAEAKAAADAAGSPAVERDAEVASAVTKKEDEAPKEPEGISFDEYLAKKVAPTAETLKLRSAGEGVAANKAWSGYTALEKADEKEAAKQATSAKEVKETKEDAAAGLLNFRIARDDGDRYEGGRGGRGGRGRGSNRGSRGRGGRGDGSRGRGGAAPAFNPTDFPSLATPQ